MARRAYVHEAPAGHTNETTNGLTHAVYGGKADWVSGAYPQGFGSSGAIGWGEKAPMPSAPDPVKPTTDPSTRGMVRKSISQIPDSIAVLSADRIPGMEVERNITSPRSISGSYSKASRGWYYSGQLGRRVLVDTATESSFGDILPNPMYRTSNQIASAMILESEQKRMEAMNKNYQSSPRDSRFTESLCNTRMSYPTTRKNGFTIDSNDMMYRNTSMDCRMNRSKVNRDPGVWKEHRKSPYISSTSVNPTLNSSIKNERIGVRASDWGKGKMQSPCIQY